MSKILLVDTNRAAVPIYRSLERWGHEVWVTGNNPAEPLARICPRYIRMDYSNLDALKDLIKKQKFHALVPGCTDVSYQVCAKVGRGRFSGIDTVEATLSLANKAEFRKLAQQLGISVPKEVGLGEATGLGSVIVKPVDSYSGRGIEVLRHPRRATLAKALKVARGYSKTKEALIEEFVIGQLYSHSAFLRAGKVLIDFVVREDGVAHPFAVDTSCLATSFPRAARISLRKDVERLSKKLSLVDGLVHTQFIYHEGRYWVIEMTRRCPGDLYSLLIEYSTGFSYAAAYAAPFVRQKLPRRPVRPKFIIRHTACPKIGGRDFWGISFREEVKIRHFIPLATVGERLSSGPLGRAALMFLAFPSRAEQNRSYDKLLQRNLYDFS
jgi:biotin carboxylase